MWQSQLKNMLSEKNWKKSSLHHSVASAIQVYWLRNDGKNSEQSNKKI